MREILRTNNPVLLSWAVAVLRGEGIAAVVLDTYTSVVEGSISAIPRRLMVPEADYQRAQELLQQAERDFDDD